MKTSSKSLLIIFAMLLIGLASVQFFGREGRSKTLKSELVSIDTALVSKIEIASGGTNILLTKDTGKWNVSDDGDTRRANLATVKSVLNSLNTIKPGRLAARKKEKWKDYAVDSTGTRVKVFGGDQLLSDIVLGRFGVEGQRNFYTFVRLFEDEDVYVANDFMKMNVYSEMDSYRDNRFLQLAKDSLTSIQFNYPDSAYTLTKSNQWLLNDAVADSSSMENYLRGLRNLTSKEFYNGEVSGEPTHSIVFSFSDRPFVKIDAFFLPEAFIMKSSENPNEFFQDEELASKVFKGRDVFVLTD